jgi:hypothetical protein
MQCSAKGCDQPVKARGMCATHYGQQYYQRNRVAVLERTKEANRRRRERPGERERERDKARVAYATDPGRAREKARRWYHRNQAQAQVAARTHARRRRASELGLTITECDAILARGCAICGAHPDDADYSFTRGLHMDHDHASGQARDALCHGCNSALGLMGDDPERLRAAADYLERHRAAET